MFKAEEILEITAGELISRGKEEEFRGISIDSRTIKKGELFIAIKGENFDGHDFIEEAIKKGAAGVIQSSKLKVQSSRRIPIIFTKDTIKALGDLAKAHRKKFKIPVIAVTGSNGKTTTKEMISSCLENRFSVLKNEGTKNNKIGLPLTLLKLNSQHNICVVELGTNHFGEIEYLVKISQPNIRVITNIGPSHLEFLNDLEGVFKEETSLIKGLNSKGICLINGDDKFLRRLAKERNIFTYGLRRPCDLMAKDLNCNGNFLRFRVGGENFSLNTAGSYNIYNAMAAIFVSLLFGLNLKRIASALKEFGFPGGRLKLREFGEIKIFDDTYNSNPLSLRFALETLSRFKGRKIFVMGDMLELGKGEEYFHKEIVKFIKRANVDFLISLGKLSKITALQVKEGKICKEVFISDSCDEVKDILKKIIEPKDLVLIKGSRKMGMERIIEKLGE